MTWRSVMIQRRTVAVVCLIVFVLCLAACANIPSDSDPLSNTQAQSTLEVLKATSQIIEANLTQTAYAPTREFIATSTAQAWIVMGWTATASNNQTATSASRTATQQVVQAKNTQRALDNTSTVAAAAVSAQTTALHGQSVSVELALDRERLMNNVWAVTPWIILVLIVIALFVAILRRTRVRPIFRDERGDAPLLIVDGKIYDADRNPQPLLDLSGKKPAIPALTDPTLQAATTMRDQMIDLVSRAQTSGADLGRRQEMAQRMVDRSLPAPQPEITVIPPDASMPLLSDVLPKIVRDAVDVDILEEQKGVG